MNDKHIHDLSVNTKHIDDVPVETWKHLITHLKFSLAIIMQRLQEQKIKIKNDPKMSKREKFDRMVDIFCEQGKLSTFLEDFLFFYSDEKEKQFNEDMRHNIDLLNE